MVKTVNTNYFSWLVLRLIVLLTLCLALTSCATTTVRSFSLFHAENTDTLFFPQAPQPARYEYLGDLVGDLNFPAKNDVAKGLWDNVLLSLTGLRTETNQAMLLRPVNGLTLQDGQVLVADAGMHGIFKFDIPQNKLKIWKKISKREHFINPVGMSVGPDSTILISDAGLGEVLAFDLNDKLVFRFGKGRFLRPTGIVYHPDSHQIFVADTQAHTLYVFNETGKYVTSYGTRGNSDSELQFNYPTFLALTNNKILVSDTMNARIVKMDINGNMIGSFGRRGYRLGELNRPKGIAVDSYQHVYLVESYFDHLLIYDGSGQLLLPLGGTGDKPGQFYLPSGVWVDQQDRIYVADMANGRVSVFQYLGEEHE